MPRYDFRCPSGHITEARASFDVSSIDCACGRAAQREPFVRGHLPGQSGFVPTPTKEHYLPLGRALEAQHEMVYAAEKAGIQAPDLWQVAKDRVKRGDVKAIE